MRNSFSFACDVCDKTCFVNQTSSGEPIKEQSDMDSEFYVTCTHCFSIFRIAVSVVKTQMMYSNFVKGKVVE